GARRIQRNHPDIRLGYQRDNDRQSPSRDIYDAGTRGGLTRAVGTLFRESQRGVPDREVPPRGMHLRPAERRQRSALPYSRPDLLLQCADLFRAGIAEESAGGISLRPQAAGLSDAWAFGKRGSAFALVLAAG